MQMFSTEISHSAPVSSNPYTIALLLAHSRASSAPMFVCIPHCDRLVLGGATTASPVIVIRLWSISSMALLLLQHILGAMTVIIQLIALNLCSRHTGALRLGCMLEVLHTHLQSSRDNT